MADRLEEILGKRFNSLKELKEEITRMQDSIVNLNTDSEEFIETNKKLIAAQEQYTSVSRAKVDVITAEDDSIIGLQKEYKKLFNEYKTWNAEKRKEHADDIQRMADLSNQINQLKINAGSYKDNIGRYSESIIESFQRMGLSMGALQAPMIALTKVFEDGGKSILGSINAISDNINKMGESIKSSMADSAKQTAEGMASIGEKVSGLQGIAAKGITAIKNLGSALKSFIAIPAVATIAAIVLAFKTLQAIAQRVKDAINQNEESQMALKVAMSQFQPVINAVSNAFDKLGTIVVKVIGFLGDAFAKFREVGAGITDFLGITKDAQNRVKEQNKLYKETAKAENELINTKREYLKLNADDSAEVERLREEASETTDLAEKKRLLTEAKEKQAEIDARNIEVAKQELVIIQEQASRTANDAEMNDKLAAALAKVSQAEADAAKNARMFNKQLNGGGGGGSALKNWREEAKKIYEETLENSKTEIQILTEKYEKEKKLLVKYNMDTTLLTKQYQKEVAKIVVAEYNKQMATESKLMDARVNSMKLYDKVYEAQSGKVAKLNKYITHLEYGTTKRLQKVSDKFNEIYNGITKDDKTSGDKKTGLLRALDIIWEYGDLSKATDLQDILDTIKYKINVLGDTSEDTALAFKELQEIGEDGWAKLIEPLQRVINDVEKLDEITITTGLDAQLQLDDIPNRVKAIKKEIEEELGNEAFKRMDELMKFQNFNLLEAFFGMDNSQWSLDEMQNYIREGEYRILEIEKEEYEKDLLNFKGTNEQKLQLLEEYYDVVNELRERDAALAELNAERNENLVKDSFARFDAEASAIQTVINSYASLIQSQINDSKITKAEGEKKIKTLKKLEAVALAVNIAQIAASTAAGIMDVWKSYGAELALNAQTAAASGPAAAATKAALDAKSLVSAILRTGAIGTAGAANIAAAAMGSISKQQSLNGQLDDLSGGGGTGAVANVQEIDSTPYTYTRTIQTQQEYDDLTQRPVWVSVSDIESGLNQRVKVVDESSF